MSGFTCTLDAGWAADARQYLYEYFLQPSMAEQGRCEQLGEAQTLDPSCSEVEKTKREDHEVFLLGLDQDLGMPNIPPASLGLVSSLLDDISRLYGTELDRCATEGGCVPKAIDEGYVLQSKITLLSGALGLREHTCNVATKFIEDPATCTLTDMGRRLLLEHVGIGRMRNVDMSEQCDSTSRPAAKRLCNEALSMQRSADLITADYLIDKLETGEDPVDMLARLRTHLGFSQRTEEAQAIAHKRMKDREAETASRVAAQAHGVAKDIVKVVLSECLPGPNVIQSTVDISYQPFGGRPWVSSHVR